MTLLARIVKNKKLVSETAWKKHITKLQKQCRKKHISLRYALLKAVEERTQKLPKYGVLFSGGVDSCLIALLSKKMQKNFICYTVGLEGSPDLIAAEKAAQQLKLPLKKKVLTQTQVEEIIKKVAKILPDVDVVSVSVASVVYAAFELAKKDEIRYFFSGLGSEEIFAGYERHMLAKDINRECWNGLRKMWKRDLVRDYALGKHFKVTLLTPFLDPNVICAAMQIPGEAKFNEKDKKIPLRRLAEEFGMPLEFAWRKKQAAQYGSRFDKALQQIARAHGYKKKGEYIQSLIQ